MTTVLKLDIAAGRETCYDPETGATCRFRGTRRLGTLPICALFPTESEVYTDLEVGRVHSQGFNGRECVLRCTACHAAEVAGIHITGKA